MSDPKASEDGEEPSAASEYEVPRRLRRSRSRSGYVKIRSSLKVVRSPKVQFDMVLMHYSVHGGLMGSKYWLFLLSASLVVSSVSNAASAATSTTKAKKKVHHSRPVSTLLAHTRGSHNMFVPPPPAYMPSILPELQYPQMAQHSVIEEAEAKVENPYSKYIYTRDPAKAPTIVQPGKYVTTWNKT